MVKNPNAVPKHKELAPMEQAMIQGASSSLFSQELGDNANEHIKELFYLKEDLQSKTDLTKNEISYISRLMYVASLTDNPALKMILEEFMKLQVSRDRKGRKEYVEATIGTSKTGQREGLFSRLGGVFGRN